MTLFRYSENAHVKVLIKETDLFLFFLFSPFDPAISMCTYIFNTLISNRFQYEMQNRYFHKCDYENRM